MDMGEARDIENKEQQNFIRTALISSRNYWHGFMSGKKLLFKLFMDILAPDNIEFPRWMQFISRFGAYRTFIKLELWGRKKMKRLKWLINNFF